VIVRIATEGQYELGESDEEALGELDNEAVSVCATGDEQQFHDVYARLLDFVRSHGQPVADDRLDPSDIIFPPPDISLEEASKEFSGEGLIPG
jgi:hypothetical protein